MTDQAMTDHCKRVQSLLSHFYDGELDGRTAGEIESHLAHCASCRQHHAAFESISQLVRKTEIAAEPVVANWAPLAAALHHTSPSHGPATEPPIRPKNAFSVGRPNLALAATFLLAVGLVAWFAIPRSSSESDLSSFVTAFIQDPEHAHAQLVSRFHGQPVDAREAAKTLGFTLASTSSSSAPFRLTSMHKLSMPCCDCLEAICRRPDGSQIAVFGHRCRTHVKVGDGPEYEVHCEGKVCRLVELPTSRYVVEWQVGDMKLLVVGAKDRDEIEQLVDWLDPELPAEKG